MDADSIMINGRRIGPADRVRVEASNFLVEGGGGYGALREGTEKVVGIADIDAWLATYAEGGTGDGR